MDQPTRDMAAAKLTNGRDGHRVSNHRGTRVDQATVRPALVGNVEGPVSW